MILLILQTTYALHKTTLFTGLPYQRSLDQTPYYQKKLQKEKIDRKHQLDVKKVISEDEWEEVSEEELETGEYEPV